MLTHKSQNWLDYLTVIEKQSFLHLLKYHKTKDRKKTEVQIKQLTFSIKSEEIDKNGVDTKGKNGHRMFAPKGPPRKRRSINNIIRRRE